MRRSSTALGALLLLLLAVPALRGQELSEETGTTGRQLVDRVAAVVGDSVILYTEVEEELLRLRAMGQELPEEPAALRQLRREVLRNLVDRELLVRAAIRDSVRVADAEVEDALERDLEQRIESFGSEAALRRTLSAEGLTLAQYREILRKDIRRSFLIERYVQMQVQQRPNPPLDSAELRTMYEAQKGQLGERPATVDFEQVVVASEPSDSAKEAALEEARSVLREIREGEDFATLAERHSDDPGSSQRGGDLGWFRRGQMVKPFEEVAFSLRPGEVGGIVETTFGYHIIKVERVRSGERKARHILIRPEVTEADVQRARERAEEVVERARSGEPLPGIAEELNDPAEPPVVGPVPRNQLPAAYASALSDAEAGELVGPVRLEAGGGDRVKWAVIRITDIRTQGSYTFEDVRDRLADQLRQQKVVEKVLEELRQSTYVDVRI